MHPAHRGRKSSLAILALPLLRCSIVWLVAGVFGITAKPAAAQPPRYQVVPVKGFWCSNALARQGAPQGINDASQVVGAAIVPFGVATTVHAVRWENEALTDLQTLPNGGGSFAYGINSAGDVVGSGDRGIPPYSPHAFLWQQPGPMTDLGVLPGFIESRALAINASGVVVGWSAGSPSHYHATLWQNDTNHTMTDLGALVDAGADSVAEGVNAAGQVAGWVTPAGAVGSTGVIWQGGALKTKIKPLEATNSFGTTPLAINSKGQVVGEAGIKGTTHAFLWENDTTKDLHLGSLPLFDSSFATGINDSGQVVGTAVRTNGPSVPFLWDAGVMTDLNTLIPANSGWNLAGATGINNRGEILGFGYQVGDASSCGFLLRPGPPVPPLLSVEDAVVEVPARGLAPYDIMVLEVPVEVSALVAAPGAQLSFSLGPGATKTGTFEGRRYSDPILSIASFDRQATAAPGFSGTKTILPSVEGTGSDAIMDLVVRADAPGFALDHALTVTASFTGPDGAPQTRTFDLRIKKRNTSETATVGYPTFAKMVGAPTGSDEVGGYYLRGDTNYHHPQDTLVRKYTLEAARYKRAEIGKSPEEVAGAIAQFVTAILNPKGDDAKEGPDYKAPDTQIVGWLKDGEIGPKKDYYPKSPGGMLPRRPYHGLGHVCIEHAYLFTSFTRTLGLPSRELTVALGKNAFSAGNAFVNQEAAAEVWTGSNWTFYDAYMFAGVTNDMQKYFQVYPTLRVWLAFDRHAEHDFSVEPADGAPKVPAQWKLRAEGTLGGTFIEVRSPVTLELTDAQGRGPAYAFLNLYDAQPSFDPSKHIAGASHLLRGALGVTDPESASSVVPLHERIFVPASEGSDPFTLKVAGIGEGPYTLVVGNAVEGQPTEIQEITRTAHPGVSDFFTISRTGGHISIALVDTSDGESGGKAHGGCRGSGGNGFPGVEWLPLAAWYLLRRATIRRRPAQ